MSSKLREALESIRQDLLDLMGSSSESLRESLACKISATIRTALAEPLRNCDVGTPEEQSDRFLRFCAKYYPCINCPAFYELNNDTACWSTWAQMPYEEVK